MSVPVATIARAWLSDQSLDAALESVAQLDALRATVTQSAVVRRFLADPRRTTSAKLEVLTEAGLSQSVANVARMLIVGRRLHDLSALTLQAKRLVRSLGGPVPASVTSVVVLDAAERRTLQRKLEALAGGAVELEETTDPSILGGLVVTLAGRRRDMSVRGRIQELRRAVAA